MNYTVIVSPFAEDDIRSAFDYYEVQRIGLGQEYVFCVEECLARIQRNPQHYLYVTKLVRRAIVKRFPYSIFYFIKTNEIHVIAVLHQKQDFKTIRKRR